jgi:hypothetical protein
VLSVWFGRILGAFAIDHAWRVWIIRTTGTMDHILDHQVVEFRFCVWIRKLCRQKGVNIICSPEFGVMLEEDDEMHVWQASLLGLNSEDVGCGDSQGIFFMSFMMAATFALKTHETKSGLSAAVCPGRSSACISGQLGSAVTVMKMSALLK